MDALIDRAHVAGGSLLYQQPKRGGGHLAALVSDAQLSGLAPQERPY
jgi:hypothetical protein